MSSKNYYRLLNVSRNATYDEIKKAYRKLAMEFHPDVNTDKGAEEKFKAIGEAYAVLGNESRRRIYDQTGYVISSAPKTEPWRHPGPNNGFERCNGGMAGGKCSGLDSLFKRRPSRAFRKKSPFPGRISD